VRESLRLGEGGHVPGQPSSGAGRAVVGDPEVEFLEQLGLGLHVSVDADTDPEPVVVDPQDATLTGDRPLVRDAPLGPETDRAPSDGVLPVHWPHGNRPLGCIHGTHAAVSVHLRTRGFGPTGLSFVVAVLVPRADPQPVGCGSLTSGLINRVFVSVMEWLTPAAST